MDLQRKFMSSAVQLDAGLGERQIRVVASSSVPDREKDIMSPIGCDLKNFLKNPIVLADHDRTKPIGTATPEIKDGKVYALIDFAPLGVSKKADEYCGLAKAGVLNSVSVGFMPIDVTPNKGGGVDINKWELLELSLVAVPANPDALVVQRSASTDAENFKVGASRNLPATKSAKWNGSAAADRILKQAGFDSDAPNSAWARKGFLVYDANSPDQKDAYQFPFADVVDGRLMIVPSALSEAKSAIEKSETIGEIVKTKALAVIAHYEGEMKKNSATIKIKSLYDVAYLCEVLECLGWSQSMAEWEAQIEEDGSKVPAMLAVALHAVGDALVAMAAEEVNELLAGVDQETKGLSDEDALKVKTLKSPLAKALLIANIKAGRKFSADSAKAMTEGCKSILAGHDAIKALLDDEDDGDIDPDTGDDEDDDEDDPDMEKSAEQARLKRLREVEVLALAPA